MTIIQTHQQQQSMISEDTFVTDSLAEEIEEMEQFKYEPVDTKNEKDCEYILNENPFDLDAKIRLAQVFLDENKNMEQVRAILKSFEENEPEYRKAEVQLLNGIYECMNKNYKLSIEHLMESLQTNPYSIQANYRLGRTYERMREFDKARYHLKKAIQRDSKCFEAILKLGVVYFKSNNVKKALKRFKEAEALNPDNLELMIKIGEIYSKDDSMNQEAEAHFKKVIEKNPKDAAAYEALGRLYMKQNKDSLAIDQFNIATYLPKPSNQAHYHLGQIYQKKQLEDEAIIHYKHCLSLDVNHFGATINLAILLAHNQEIVKSQKYFKHAIKLNPKSI